MNLLFWVGLSSAIFLMANLVLELTSILDLKLVSCFRDIPSFYLNLALPFLYRKENGVYCRFKVDSDERVTFIVLKRVGLLGLWLKADKRYTESFSYEGEQIDVAVKARKRADDILQSIKVRQPKQLRKLLKSGGVELAAKLNCAKS